MFDWSKYDTEIRKRNTKTILLLFALWIVFTVFIGLSLAHVVGMPFMVLGFIGYAMAVVYFKWGGDQWQNKEHHYYWRKLEREAFELFLKEKGLYDEFLKWANEPSEEK